MSLTLEVLAFSGKENKEYLKHFNAVKFCVENELSYPIETKEFFKGKVNGYDLDEINRPHVLNYLKEGVSVPLKYTYDRLVNEVKIKVSEITPSAELIIIKLH